MPTDTTDDEMTAGAKERAIAFAEGLAAASGLDLVVMTRDEGNDTIQIAFEGPDCRYLVGRSGQVLDALQYLTQLSANEEAGQ